MKIKKFYGMGIVKDAEGFYIDVCIGDEDGGLPDFVWMEIAKKLHEKGEKVELNVGGRIETALIYISKEEYSSLHKNPLKGNFRGINLEKLAMNVARRLALEEIESILEWEEIYEVPENRLENAVRFLMGRPLQGRLGYNFDYEELLAILGGIRE